MEESRGIRFITMETVIEMKDLVQLIEYQEYPLY